MPISAVEDKVFSSLFIKNKILFAYPCLKRILEAVYCRTSVASVSHDRGSGVLNPQAVTFRITYLVVVLNCFWQCSGEGAWLFGTKQMQTKLSFLSEWNVNRWWFVFTETDHGDTRPADWTTLDFNLAT